MGKIDRTQRNLGLDLVKAICIILMVVGHSGAPKWLHDAIYMFHMPCFFIVSGYLFKKKYLDCIKKFIHRKIVTLWKPFVIWSFIFILFHNFFNAICLYEDSYTIRDCTVYGLRALMMRESEMLLGGFWFIGSLFLASVMSIIYFRFFGMTMLRLASGIVIFIFISLFFNYYNIRLWNINAENFLATAYFMTGTLLREVRIEGRSRQVTVMAAITFLALFSVFMPGEMPHLTVDQVIPYYMVSSLVSWALIVVCSNLTPTRPINWIVKVGGRTMDILIFHFLAFKLVSYLKITHYGLPITYLAEFPVIEDNNGFYWIIYSVAGVVISLLLADGISWCRTLLLKQYRKFKMITNHRSCS